MTDSTTPSGTNPEDVAPEEFIDRDAARDADDAGTREEADRDRSASDEPGGADDSGAEPGAPGNAEPMTDSTDGGLSGGDPGVEE
ncbi:hypothetical protein [Agromyces sp. LHK192]|uniref:hypothetical protein n=1 Tax=Agromyces sp. LHK192 TaxID=2498704 RepID=UPI000FD93C30|nr:hypothetical protein [Agromyces sp. LHK192]